MDEIREQVHSLVRNINPVDEAEGEHQALVLKWIENGDEIFRLKKPDVPPMHLVSYLVLLDRAREKILLVDHKLSGLLLPAGGHVEYGEHPRVTIEQEIVEELGIKALWHTADPKPLFLSATVTTGDIGPHTDVSFWYVVEGDVTEELDWDPGEFKGIRWFDLSEVEATPISKLDPQLHRFVRKLRIHLAA